MRNTIARRWLAGFGVVGALVAAASPASAAAPQASLGVYFLDSTIAAGPGIIDSPILYGSEPLVLHNVKVTYDFSDLAGKARVVSEGDGFEPCTPDGDTRLVCEFLPELEWELDVDEWGTSGYFGVAIVAEDGVKPGAEGALKVSFGAAGFDTVTHQARVRIGEGVDLAAGAETAVTSQPGGKVTAPLTVRNAGETTVKGTNVLFYNDYDIRAEKRYSNCTYVDDELRTCHFDTPLTPGASYTASLAYALGADAYAPGGAYGEIGWLTADEFEDYTAYLDTHGVDIGKPGTDGELTLTEVGGPKALARTAQADTDPSNNWSSLDITVTGTNGVDLAAIGDTITGTAGKVVPATLGFKNNGPATLDFSRGGGPITNVDIEVPAGTTAVTVPDECVPRSGDQPDWEEPGKPGARSYRCYPGSFIAVGEERTVDFEFRIDQVIADAAGRVTINPECECEGFTADLNPANDVAQILVNPTGDNGTGGNGDGGSGGGGGGLPVTGAATGAIVGVGSLLIALGVVGFVLSRRRRARFVA
jgi:hypothetical protein